MSYQQTIDCPCGKNYTLEGKTCGMCTDEQEFAYYVARAGVALKDCFEPHELKRVIFLVQKFYPSVFNQSIVAELVGNE